MSVLNRCQTTGSPDLPERLLLCSVYLRLYISQSLLPFLFDLDNSNIRRELNGRLLPILLAVLPVSLRDASLLHLAQDKDTDRLNLPSPKPKRRHSTLGYLSPKAFERHY